MPKRKVFLVNKDDESDNLLVEEVSANNPVGVEIISRVSLSKMFLEKGIALKKNTLSKCTKNWRLIEDKVNVADDENENVESPFNMKYESNVSDMCMSFSIRRRLSLSQAPTVPANQVFAAMLLHIDCSGLVWDIPKTDWWGLSEMVTELVSCAHPVEEVPA